MMSNKLKYIILICISSFCFIVMNLINKPHGFPKLYQNKNKSGVQKIKKDTFNNVDKRGLKYILVWPSNKFEPFSEMQYGQEDFIKLQCPVMNCYITSNRTYFKNVRDFDVIVFMGNELSKDDLPTDRAQDQIYIYLNMYSSADYPVEDDIFDGFFNGTATYRLDSDIPLPHILIRDFNGFEVGPRKHMSWLPVEDLDYEKISTSVLKHKDRAAAIFMSNCESLSAREELVAKLQKELNLFGLTIDVYGRCGRYKCAKSYTKCNEMLRKKYYFYLAYENALDKDYVSEKVLTPLKNYVVPIVFGGANYTRFLPPGSYLNALALSPIKLAKTMLNLMTYPDDYLKYFWWNNFYSYHNPKKHENICKICAAISNNKLWNRDKTRKFRDWWNVNYTAFQVLMRKKSV